MPGTPFAPFILDFQSHSLCRLAVGFLHLMMEEYREMMYFVRTEVRGGNVDQLAQKIVNREIPRPGQYRLCDQGRSHRYNLLARKAKVRPGECSPNIRVT